jgi:WXG100 family type VII secretion target
MPTIHIDTDLMRTLGGNLVSINEQLQSLQTPVASLSSQLENSWVGTGRSVYDNLYQDWQAKVKAIILSGEDLGKHLQTTATAFETANNSAL